MYVCIIFMKINKKIKANKQSHHDDCDDCKKQRKENQALMSIYQKLQAVDLRSKKIRDSVDIHKDQCTRTRSKFGQLSVKFSSLPKDSKTTMQLQHMGHQLARQMLENTLKGPAKKQNERLKQILKRMHKTKYLDVDNNNKQKSNIQVPNRNSKSVLDIFQSKDLSISHNNFSLNISNARETYTDKDSNIQTPSMRYWGQVISQQDDEQSDTKTTGFISNRKMSNQYNKFDELNLWLYDSHINKNLQQSLYQVPLLETRTKNSFRINERKSKNLPALASSHRK